MLLKPNLENHCFGCGGANALGMQLAFEQDDTTRRIRGVFRIGAQYQEVRALFMAVSSRRCWMK